jgi:hypothetical protein
MAPDVSEDTVRALPDIVPTKTAVGMDAAVVKLVTIMPGTTSGGTAVKEPVIVVLGVV